MLKFKNLTKYAIAPLVAIALCAMAPMPADAGMASSSIRPSTSFSSSTAKPSSPSYSKPPMSAPVDRPATVYSKPAPAFTPAPAVADKPTSTYSKPSPSINATAAPSIDKPSTTYSKPPTVSAAAPSSNGYSKPGAVSPAPIASTAPAPKTYTSQVVDTKSVLGAKSSRVMSNDALNQYKAERSTTNLNPPRPVDVEAIRRDPGFAAATNRYGSVNSYMAARQTNINIYRSAHPDVYIYSSHISPNYGPYDSGFLVGLVLGIGDANANAAWLYAHQSDPWYAEWHADLLRQAQNDAALQARLDAQAVTLATLKASGAVPNSSALPPGVDASVAIAPEAMIAQASVDQESSDASESHWGRNIGIILVLLVGGVLVYFYFVGSKK